MARAIDLAMEVLPTPGGPTNNRMWPRSSLSSPLPGPYRRVLAGGADGRRETRALLILHVLQTVMVLLENLRRPVQVERFLGPLVPGELGHGFQVRPNDLGLHRVAVRALQPRELAVDLLLGRLGERQSAVSRSRRSSVSVSSFLLAQLLPDRLQLLGGATSPAGVLPPSSSWTWDLMSSCASRTPDLALGRASSTRRILLLDRYGLEQRPWRSALELGCRGGRRRGPVNRPASAGLLVSTCLTTSSGKPDF